MRYNCPFCSITTRRIASGKDTDQVAQVTRDVFAIAPLGPVTPGHLLFVHEIHTRTPHEDGIVTADVAMAAARWVSLHYDGDYNLIWNSGGDAGQTVNHLHLHFVPRRENDGLRLPWTGQNTTERTPE